VYLKRYCYDQSRTKKYPFETIGKIHNLGLFRRGRDSDGRWMPLFPLPMLQNELSIPPTFPGTQRKSKVDIYTFIYASNRFGV